MIREEILLVYRLNQYCMWVKDISPQDQAAFTMGLMYEQYISLQLSPRDGVCTFHVVLLTREKNPFLKENLLIFHIYSTGW